MPTVRKHSQNLSCVDLPVSALLELNLAYLNTSFGSGRHNGAFASVLSRLANAYDDTVEGGATELNRSKKLAMGSLSRAEKTQTLCQRA